ncbi:QcrA and Rieske domain-containing protein [Nonomuraea sediminis]|uniref:QcrA and Rieske domain-containing protein n=1 Tax=Nonomuraea sediminis TaxID=2835864 RepID=UPI001BDD5C29|nr:Rieske (2Fe-2S) protein [Nonomuraea sediminis]
MKMMRRALLPLRAFLGGTVLSLTAWLQARVRHKLGLPTRGTPDERTAVQDDIKRRTALRGGLIAAATTAVGVAAGSALALARRPVTSPRDSASTGPVIAAAADIAAGSAKPFTAPNGAPAYLLRPTPDTFLAFNATCTHQGCPISYVGPGFRCPCHGSTFDENGQVTGGPARASLIEIPVKVIDGQITIA